MVYFENSVGWLELFNTNGHIFFDKWKGVHSYYYTAANLKLQYKAVSAPCISTHVERVGLMVEVCNIQNSS